MFEWDTYKDYAWFYRHDGCKHAEIFLQSGEVWVNIWGWCDSKNAGDISAIGIIYTSLAEAKADIAKIVEEMYDVD
jgi:hypothetical protein